MSEIEWTPEIRSPHHGRAEELARLRREAEEGRHYGAVLRAIHDRLPLVVWRVDQEGICTYQEGKALEEAGLTPGQAVGSSLFEIYPPETVDFIRRALAGESTTHITEAHGVTWENWVVPMRDHGKIVGAIGFSVDVTALHRAERELREKIAMIERQQVAIRQLSTPIMQVWDGVLTLPLIGIIDSTRTATVMDDLLQAVSRTGARFAILDLTGVDAVDTRTAAYLIDIVRAIRLLGAEGIITGIRPSVAQTVASLGVELGGVVTLANMQAGLRHCIARLRRESSPV